MSFQARDRWRQKMVELRARQNARASARNAFPGWAPDELAAVRDLAVEIWGRKLANVFGSLIKPGEVCVGYFHADDPELPPHKRQQTVVATGRSHREIVEQIKLWREAQG